MRLTYVKPWQGLLAELEEKEVLGGSVNQGSDSGGCVCWGPSAAAVEPETTPAPDSLAGSCMNLPDPSFSRWALIRTKN